MQDWKMTDWNMTDCKLLTYIWNLTATRSLRYIKSDCSQRRKYIQRYRPNIAQHNITAHVNVIFLFNDYDHRQHVTVLRLLTCCKGDC